MVILRQKVGWNPAGASISDDAPEEIRHKEMYIGSAGADSQRALWRQIGKAVNELHPLPFSGIHNAIEGKK
jgi:hypothetical protein